ncbi:MAG TPA: nuclear transport factor 2 family protein [Sphingomonas sp.]|nr:nuclear transport factor 2 family protein [Sphingomonas sp.]
MTETHVPERSGNLDRLAAIDLVQEFMALLVDPARSDEVRPLITDEYIQHNPNIPSGPDAIIAFTKSEEAEVARSSMRPATDPPMFVHEGDKIVMILPRDLPDPADPSKTYRSYWFDMWRIEDGKLAEHWDGAPKE